jgi:osmotically inducible protein OsmC
MNTLYSTKGTATGGRHGQIRSEDGLLEMKLALPRQLGGKGDATNPETLFAGGYAACFENALLHVSRDAGLRFADADVEVVAEVGLSRNDSGGFVLSVALAVTVAGVDQKKAEELLSLPTKSAPIPMLFGATSTLGSRFRFVEQDRTKTWNRSRALL